MSGNQEPNITLSAVSMFHEVMGIRSKKATGQSKGTIEGFACSSCMGDRSVGRLARETRIEGGTTSKERCRSQDRILACY